MFLFESLDFGRSVWDHLGLCLGLSTPFKVGVLRPPTPPGIYTFAPGHDFFDFDFKKWPRPVCLGCLVTLSALESGGYPKCPKQTGRGHLGDTCMGKLWLLGVRRVRGRILARRLRLVLRVTLLAEEGERH